MFLIDFAVLSCKTLKLHKLCKINNFTITFPDKILCGDNAAMIAWAGIQRSKKNLKNDNPLKVPQAVSPSSLILFWVKNFILSLEKGMHDLCAVYKPQKVRHLHCTRNI